MKKTMFIAGILLTHFGLSQFAYAWGQYGHEQINRAAAEVLPADAGIGLCLQSDVALKTIIRYAITPDMEWKTDTAIKTLSPEVAQKRKQDSNCEHPLHFFEADAFLTPGNGQGKPGTYVGLPSGNYTQDGKDGAYAQYAKLLQANSSYVLQVDPLKKIHTPVTPDDVVAHGTAPWRAQQLFNLAVASLRTYGNSVKANPDHPDTRSLQLAFVYLGTMGHYVGDMSQPFHASLNYDGVYYNPADAVQFPPHEFPHDGIHHEIDTALLPGGAVQADKKDSTNVYSSFSATDGPVTALVRSTELPKYSKSTISGDQVVSLMMKMIDDGYPMVTQLVDVYRTRCHEANQKSNQSTTAKASDTSVATQSTAPSRHPAQVLSGVIHDSGHGAKHVGTEGDSSAKEPYCMTVDEKDIQGATEDLDASGDREVNSVGDNTNTNSSADSSSSLSRKSRKAVRSLSESQQKKFAASMIGSQSVTQILEARMAASAGLLAKLWASAYTLAGKPNLGDCGRTELVFDQNFAIQNYPKPDYYPQGAVPACFKDQK